MTAKVKSIRELLSGTNETEILTAKGLGNAIYDYFERLGVPESKRTKILLDVSTTIASLKGWSLERVQREVGSAHKLARRLADSGVAPRTAKDLDVCKCGHSRSLHLEDGCVICQLGKCGTFQLDGA